MSKKMSKLMIQRKVFYTKYLKGEPQCALLQIISGISSYSNQKKQHDKYYKVNILHRSLHKSN